MSKSCNTRTMEAPSAAFATASEIVPANDGFTPAVQVAGFDPNRRSVTITTDADAAGSAFVLSSESSPIGSGVRVPPGAGLTLNTAAAVYVRAAAATLIYVLTESGSIG